MAEESGDPNVQVEGKACCTPLCLSDQELEDLAGSLGRRTFATGRTLVHKGAIESY